MLHIPELKESMEAIAFQGKSLLFKEITAHCQELLDLNDSSRQALFHPKDGNGVLNQICFKHTGIRCKFKWERKYKGWGYNAHALPSFGMMIQSSGFREYVELVKHVQKNYRGFDFTKEYREILKSEGLLNIDAVGWIDLEKSKLGGMLSSDKFGYEIVMWPDMFDGRFTAEELASVYLHEIGHIFHASYYWFRMAYTTTTIDAAWTDLVKASDKEVKVRVVDNTAKSLRIQVADAQTLAETDSKEYFQTLMLSSVIKDYNSSSGTTTYDHRSAEQFADQFAARHGAARASMGFEEKIHRYYGTSLFWSSGKFTFFSICRALVMAIIFPLGLLELLSMTVLLFCDDAFDDRYDTPKLRCEKLHMQIVGELKKKDLDPERRKELLDDEKYTVDLLKQMTDHMTYYERLWVWVSKKRRDDREAMQFQIELERLIHNRLYVQSQKLRNL